LAMDECHCRKPAPGLLFQAASELSLDLTRSWIVGDKNTDLEAGRRAGCRGLLLNPDDSASTWRLVVQQILSLPAPIDHEY
jgi:histidinol phosphatase-like enzyme